MQYALTILTYLFDMFILTTFLMNTLHHFKKRYAPLYLCVLVGCECCLYGCKVLTSHFPTMQSEITATLISLGTTDAIITASISETCISRTRSQSTKYTPYSSDVRAVPVVIRNVLISFFPSNSPTVIFVFPTSTANNIYLPLS